MENQCSNALEIFVTFEVCNHVGHAFSALQEIIDHGSDNNVFFIYFEFCRGCDAFDGSHCTVHFSTESREDGDWAARSFCEREDVVMAGCNCVCPKCTEPTGVTKPDAGDTGTEKLKKLGLN